MQVLLVNVLFLELNLYLVYKNNYVISLFNTQYEHNKHTTVEPTAV
jgi:hypothetical protein